MSTVKRECLVVMLPTKKASDIYITKDRGVMVEGEKMFPEEEYPNLLPQHIYILSDEVVRCGEYAYYPELKEVMLFDKGEVYEKGRQLKVIATTDTLRIGASGINLKESIYLPQPSQAFVQKFIDAYNSGKPIEKVMVEYSEYEIPGKPMGRKRYVLRVNPKDNTITITKVKDFWNREEIEDLLDRNTAEITAIMLNKFKDYRSPNEVKELLSRMSIDIIKHLLDGESIPSFQFEKWIEDNV